MAKREADLEKEFAAQVKKHGGRPHKFTSPGRKGRLDQLVLWPVTGRDPMASFVELKRDAKAEMSVLQQEEFDELKAFGVVSVHRVHSLLQVASYIEESRRTVAKLAEQSRKG